MSNIIQFSPTIGRPCEVGGSLGRTMLINRPSSTAFSSSFAAPSHGTRDFENGALPTAYYRAPSPSINAGTGISSVPRAVSGGWGYSCPNDPAQALTGNYSMRYDYSETTSSAHDTNAQCFANNPNGIDVDELYWRFNFKIVGTPPMTELKWNRFTVVNPVDNFGLYYTYNSFAFSWGRHDVGNGNFSHCIGFHGGTWPTGLTSTYGYTKYAENICNDGQYHRILCHVQQNPPISGSTPRVRFWLDGVPIIQNPSGMRNSLNSQVYTGGAFWTAPDPNDPDYGPDAPSWLDAGNRYDVNKIYSCDICVAMNQNASNTGTGYISYDDMAWSTGALAP